MRVTVRKEVCRSAGFTLIEILLVLALVGLVAALLPSGLRTLYQKSNDQLLVEQVVVAARQCAVTAQQQQRSVSLGSFECPLPADLNQLSIDFESLPRFHADGTASRTAHMILPSGDKPKRRITVVVIDRLTANVSLQINAQYQ